MKKNVLGHTPGINFPGVEKILLKMKLTLFIVVFSFLGAMATESYSQTKLSLDLRNTTVKEVLDAIENQSEFFFLYSEKVIDVNRKVDVEVQQSTIDKILDKIFEGTNISYTVKDRQIVLTTPEAGNLNVPATVPQEQRKIRGKVADQTGTPIPGASVVVKGTTIGITTSDDGSYTLSVPDNAAVLIFSFVGMKSQEVEIQGKTTINVSLTEDAIGIEEVVAIGYGTVKKRDVTGSVGSVNAETITQRGTTSPMEALQGNLAGVQISSSTGRIGDGYKVSIRGKNSMSPSANPLYIVDGVPTDGIDFLNPQEITRVDVLKDASSTAIYGSRGSNGVVIVTTKSGADAKKGVDISYNGYYGIREAARLPELMDGEKWWYYHDSAYLATANKDPKTGTVTAATLWTAAVGPQNSLLEQRHKDGETTNWYDEVLQRGNQQNHYLALSGKSENNVAYSVGLGYQNDTGNIMKEAIDKYSFKGSINHEINNQFSFGLNFSGSLTEQEKGSDLTMREAFRLAPYLSPYGLDGQLYPQPGKMTDANGNYLINATSTYNPILEMQNSSNNMRKWNSIGNMFLQYKPMTWLALKTTFSFGLETYRNGLSWGAMTNAGVSNNNLPSAQRITSENFNYTWDNQFDINRKYGDHSFNILGVQSVYSSRIETSNMYAKNMPFDTGFYNMGSGQQSTYVIGSNYIKQTLLSFSMRLNYTYKDRYLVTISNRWDGSSLLSEGNKWESFPSGALAWRVSEESFMKDIKPISNLKVRVSYGFTGNNIVAPYSSVNKLDRNMFYDYFGVTANGWLPKTIANTQLTWEKTKEINGGLDFGFLGNRIFGSVDLYNRLSDGLLMPQKLPKESGWDVMNANVGSVRNKGIEVTLTTMNVTKKDFSWETSFIFNKNKNEIVSLYGQNKVNDIGNGWFIGESIDAKYNYRFDGVWQADQAAEAAKYGQTVGQAKVVDANKDGKIIAADDKMIIGSSNPKWSGSFSSKMNYKNFDFSFSIFTNQGILAYSYFHVNFIDMKDRGRNKLNIPDWFIPVNDAGVTPMVSNKYPMPRNEGTYWNNDGVGYYKDASYVKVQNITLGYTFGSPVTKKLGLKHLRVYTNILNPFVFTPYDGFDPEWAQAPYETNGGGVSSIIYQFGLSVNF